ncbi:hypothetical protein LCGC14_0391960 [marine sediment metagenome]|uniref:Uncharacterized protein n=1 Tax=marine sediment metagenome TaxID=412755 RepID=A0A0F9TH58_9ZZZZ
MIDYSKVKRGDILRLVGAGAPGMAKLGDLLRVTKIEKNGVHVEDVHGEPIHFVYNCGAVRLEPTEWKDDFPREALINEEGLAILRMDGNERHIEVADHSKE